VLHSGRRLGHRSLRRFYRQKFGGDETALALCGAGLKPGGPKSGGMPRLLGAYATGRIEQKLALRAEAKKRHGVLTRSFAFSGQNSKAISSAFQFKADPADNKHARAITHHWGAGGGGSHYHMAGSVQFQRGVTTAGALTRGSATSHIFCRLSSSCARVRSPCARVRFASRV
jgi:pre-60S factor REI1